MDDFPPNNRRTPSEPEKKVKKIVQGVVVQKKQPLNKRILHTFFKGEARSTWSGVMIDVAIPAIKDLGADLVTQTVERMIFGEARSRIRRPSMGSGGYSGPQVSYNRYGSSNIRPQNTPTDRGRTPTSLEFQDVVLEARAEGEEVLEQMYILLEEYKAVSVSDLYEMLGLTAVYTHQKWGWTDLRGSEVVRQRDGGYLLSLPRPMPID